eukprot:TRINITY_DN31861_c0_g1_i1.p1 TRINITY_DN31861_c0_g1~~TRINITY_DN31861_c0_g1_i1.p1  ORF type:complete len:710 (-),score=113.07 TRINITY_DN31861_c0_g1_i1:355-2484(-)
MLDGRAVFPTPRQASSRRRNMLADAVDAESGDSGDQESDRSRSLRLTDLATLPVNAWADWASPPAGHSAATVSAQDHGDDGCRALSLSPMGVLSSPSPTSNVGGSAGAKDELRMLLHGHAEENVELWQIRQERAAAHAEALAMSAAAESATQEANEMLLIRREARQARKPPLTRLRAETRNAVIEAEKALRRLGAPVTSGLAKSCSASWRSDVNGDFKAAELAEQRQQFEHLLAMKAEEVEFRVQLERVRAAERTRQPRASSSTAPEVLLELRRDLLQAVYFEGEAASRLQVAELQQELTELRSSRGMTPSSNELTARLRGVVTSPSRCKREQLGYHSPGQSVIPDAQIFQISSDTEGHEVRGHQRIRPQVKASFSSSPCLTNNGSASTAPSPWGQCLSPVIGSGNFEPQLSMAPSCSTRSPNRSAGPLPPLLSGTPDVILREVVATGAKAELTPDRAGTQPVVSKEALCNRVDSRALGADSALDPSVVEHDARYFQQGTGAVCAHFVCEGMRVADHDDNATRKIDVSESEEADESVRLENNTESNAGVKSDIADNLQSQHSRDAERRGAHSITSENDSADSQPLVSSEVLDEAPCDGRIAADDAPDSMSIPVAQSGFAEGNNPHLRDVGHGQNTQNVQHMDVHEAAAPATLPAPRRSSAPDVRGGREPPLTLATALPRRATLGAGAAFGRVLRDNLKPLQLSPMQDQR